MRVRAMAGSRVVHHGTGRARTIQSGIGPVPVQRHKVRDRSTDLPAKKRIRFATASSLLVAGPLLVRLTGRARTALRGIFGK